MNNNICIKCKKEFNSRSGLYKHNLNYHQCDLTAHKQIQIIDSVTCKYCNKEFSNYSNRWRHEKTCNRINIENTIKNMQSEINNLKAQINNNSGINNITNNSNNTNSNNNLTQNIIYVIPFSKEPTNTISTENLNAILNEHGLNSVMEIVKLKHFNPETPELHNFCVTAKNDPYASIVDPETKKIKLVNKKDVFDKVYMGVVGNLTTVENPNEETTDTINRINNIPVSKKIQKKLHLEMNQEAYNNKELVQTTWKNANFSGKPTNTQNKVINKNIKYINTIELLLKEISSKSYLFKKYEQDNINV
jgi:hypothetical protein